MHEKVCHSSDEGREKDASFEPIAIIGMAFKFPQGAESSDSFWDILSEKRCVATTFPKDRFNIDAFWHSDSNRQNIITPREAHFMAGDVGQFDAAFFSMTPQEVGAMDPQQRGLLETSYQAFENAGLALNKVNGSNTSVHIGCFSSDFSHLTLKDAERVPMYAAAGTAGSILANRLSWYYNLRGESAYVDTACSSGLVATALACEQLNSGKTDMAIAGAANVILHPEFNVALSNMNLLSPSGRCKSFDASGDGYGRGEGFATLILKRVSDALACGDPIRAVIRSVGTNQDGYTSGGITQPSKEMQVALIRDTYRKAGLSLNHTRFFEAHGTGTGVGDPIEARAIEETFLKCRSEHDPLYVGAVKSNIGHLEGASGLASIIKTVLALERGVIPPNSNFEKLNPQIDAAFFNLRFPQDCVPWPQGDVRRASINSFGFGGTNAHVVIDSAENFLMSHSMHQQGQVITKDVKGSNPCLEISSFHGPELLVLSAGDEDGIKRQAIALSNYVCSQHPKLDEQNVRNIVYTLNTRRTLLDWKAYTVLDSASCLSSLCDRLEKAVRGVAAASPRELGLVFTGQGAQWAGMGRELLDWQVFRNSIEHSQKSLETLGCDWTITGKQDRAQLVAHITDRDEIDELIKGPESSRMNETEISQTVSTVVQIGLVDLMKNLQLNISVVVGHSSGEIAAAYCAGLLCHASAVKVAYFRGLLAHKLSQTSNVSYGMLSVGVSWCQMREELLRIQAEQPANGKFDANKITISCINSPSNVTVSGPRELLEIVLEDFKTRDVFVRKLKVDLGYHSPQMNAIAEAYLNHLGELRSAHTQDVIRMVSSVTAEPVDKSAVCNASYWVQNMLCPVRFVDAMDLCSKRTAEEKDVHKLDLSHESRIVTDGWLEVGPHAALKGPLREIFTTTNRNDMFYASLLLRGKSALHTLLDAVGKLHCHDFKVDLTVMDRLQGARSKLPRTITTLPPYPFNHSITYWGNSSQAKTARKRQHPSNDLLGTQVMDWNPLDARWRLIIKKDSMPWIEHHMVHGKILYPGAGMLVMAIEAIKQVVTGQNIIGYEIRNASFTAPIILSDSSEGGEVRTNMAPTLIHASDTEYNFRVLVRRADDSWQEACAGTIVAESSKGTQDVTSKTEFEYNRFIAMAELHNASAACQTVVEPEKLYQKISENSGLQYGPMFQPLSNISYSSDGRGRADILPYLGSASETLQSFTIHPSTLDGIFQCIYLGLSKGWSEPFPTLVPSHLTRLWVSTVGVGHGMSGLDIASSSSNTLSKRTAVGSAHVFSQSDMNIRLEIEALELTEMPAPNDLQREASAPQPLCRKLDWKPDINMMTVEEMTDYCVEHRSSGTEPVEWFQNLRNMMLGFAAQALDRLDALQSHAIDAQAQYTYWLRSRVDEHLRSAEPDEKCKLLDSCVLEHGRQELFDDSKRGKLSAIVGERLFEILTGNLDPLEVIFADQALVNDYYREANQTGKAFDMLAAYLDALCHESPGQRYLEIGAGTGATTTWILRTIANPAAGVRYSEYHYTDISPYFLSHGTNVYADYSGMKYMTLNIEEDPMVQGYDQESYDVIIAANVLHATSDLGVTLGHVRKLLKPDGKLILMELTTPLNIDTAFVFGLLPGWWLSSEAYRSNGAVISEEQWDEVLRCNGFSGCDQTFRDWDDDQCHGWSIIITSISTPDLSSSSARPRSRSIAIVADSKSSMQRDVAERLKRDLECPKVEVEIMSLGDLYLSSDLNTKDVILLNGLDVCLLHDMHSYLFQAVQRLITSSKSVVWVNNMGSEQDDAPYWAMTDGLVRVCRNENIDIPLATLALQASNVDSTARQIGKVLSVIYNSITTDTMDLDWMEVDGRLCISRLSKAEHIDEYIFMRTERPVRRRKFGFGPPLKLDIKTPGLLDTIEWVDDTAAYLPLQPDDIEVRVQAIGMNSKECLTLLGRVNADQMGSEAAGIVHRLGSNVTDFRVGDRVVLGTANTYQTFVRVKHAVHLPDSISFVDAASIPTAFCTAYIGLVQVARLQKGETVLIHAAAGGTGQAAAQLARNIGAEVFVTVGSKMKKDLIIEQYQIPDDHIFYSRDASFADGVKRMTKGRGVDVILNSLSGKLLVASWESIAPFGRFVEIGRKSIDTRESLPMLPFIKNTMFAGVDIDAFLVGEAAKRGMEILREVFKMTEDGIIHPPYPVSRYTIDQAEDAFRLLQSGNNAGKMVLDVSEDVLVPVREAINGAYRFKSDATYVVSGAFGGIGRQISRWLARRGAQNIILLSRSTPEKNVEAHRLVNELESLGISIRNASCDVSDFESLQGALGHMSKDMPPIKGCFQAAMVLHDRPFSTMQFEEWASTIRPKVQGSWNLHKTMPAKMDFFVMLSSATGIVGNPGQGNYAAGNTFQDALARYRVGRGEKATALDLGVVLGEGFVAENKEIHDKLVRLNTMDTISQKQLFAMLDYACHPDTSYETDDSSHIISGLMVPSQLLNQGVELPFALNRSLFRGMHQIPFVASGATPDPDLLSRTDTETLFKDASSLQEAGIVAAEALKGKMLKVLGLGEEERTVGDRMASFGVDSLVVLEIRKWISRELRADIATFEILGEGTVSDIGLSIARKSALKKEQWQGE